MHISKCITIFAMKFRVVISLYVSQMKSVVKISILTAIFAIAMFSCEEKDIINVESMTIAISPAPGAGNTVNLGSTLTATVTVLPDNAKNKSVTFTSSNPAVISVAASGGTLNTERAGQATITATANDGSGISASINLTVVMPAITVTVSGTFLYTGEPIEPSDANVTVKAGDVTLTEGRDYTLSYANNIEVGTATVTATGAGLYVGVVKTANFTITPFTGAGTSADPYKIETPQHLAKLAEVVNTGWNTTDMYFILTANIDLTAYGLIWNGNKGWIPIGKNDNPFKGFFDGNKYIVSGLYLNDSSFENAGLFGVIAGGAVKNLGVEGVVRGKYHVGGVAGNIANGGSITNCYASVNVSGSLYVGGVAGSVGNIYTDGSVANCFAIGTAGGNGRIGGVAGIVYGSVTNCYATSEVSGEYNVGGVAGYIYSSNSNVTNCAALNPILLRTSGISQAFGRVATTYGILANNVAWSGMTVLGSTVSSNNGSSAHGANITTLQAKTKATYTDLDWKFDGSNDASPWKMGAGSYGLPVFYWQTTAPAAMPTHLQ